MFLNLSAQTAEKINWLEHYVQLVLPYIVTILEIMGIIVVAWSAIYAFSGFVKNTFFHKNYNIQYKLAMGLATGLEFKMAAEILKTVWVKNVDELLILGAVIILRAILSVLIHFEMKKLNKEDKED